MTEFFHDVSDLFLKFIKSTNEWKESPSLITAWKRLLFLVLFTVVANIIVAHTPIIFYINEISNGPYNYKVAMAFIFLISLILHAALTIEYFKYALNNNRSINFGNIIFFYILSIILFGTLSFYIFQAEPSFYQYSSEHILWNDKLGNRAPSMFLTKMYFILYSLFKSIGGNFIYIESKSLLTSMLIFIQSLYSFALVSLFVAGYINQRTK
jgi:hypothetical protein